MNTLWSTTLSSKDKLHPAMNFRVSCIAQLVTQQPQNQTDKTCVLHRADSPPEFPHQKVRNAIPYNGLQMKRHPIQYGLQWTTDLDQQRIPGKEADSCSASSNISL